MLLTMLSARLPCSAIFSRLPVSISIVSSISARLSSSSVAIAGAVVSFNSSSSSTDRLAKLLTKLSGFLISWAMPAVSWPERGHLLGLDQIGLRRLQIAIGGFGGIPSGADFGFGPLALGDVAVDQHEAAIGHRVVAHLDDPAIGAGAFEA